MSEIKTCSRCGVSKSIETFAPRTDNKPHKQYFRGVCRECHNLRTREHWKRIRETIFNHYGWKCECCGETIKEFLSLDHKDNDGYLDKNPNGSKKSGKELYLLVIKQGLPDKYQTLCMNCNWAKKVCGTCPHKSNSKTNG